MDVGQLDMLKKSAVSVVGVGVAGNLCCRLGGLLDQTI